MRAIGAGNIDERHFAVENGQIGGGFPKQFAGFFGFHRIRMNCKVHDSLWKFPDGKRITSRIPFAGFQNIHHGIAAQFFHKSTTVILNDGRWTDPVLKGISVDFRGVNKEFVTIELISGTAGPDV